MSASTTRKQCHKCEVRDVRDRRRQARDGRREVYDGRDREIHAPGDGRPEVEVHAVHGGRGCTWPISEVLVWRGRLMGAADGRQDNRWWLV